MILTWMLYCTVVSLLLGLGALGAERALHAYARPVRWAWAGAILLSLLLPFGLRHAPRPAWLFQEPEPVGAAVELGTVEVLVLPSEEPRGALARLVERADALLLPGWGVTTVLLLLGVGAAFVLVHLRRRRWRWGRVAGEAVRISEGTGPAVVGLFPGEIVLPEWTLSLDLERQRLVVEHEREHLRAGDPLLLAVALLAAVLVPWNAALWWHFRRLRLAVEVDCDARVLRRRPDVRAYGLLLLEVGEMASTGRLPAAALSEPRSFLERRIHMMTSSNTARRLSLTVAATGVCAVALAAAALPVPAQPELSWSTSAERTPAAPADTIPVRGRVYDVRQVERKPELQNPSEVAQLLRNLYPPLLKSAGITGSAQVTLVINEEGRVAEARALSATHEAFGEAAVEVMRQARFRPAAQGGKPVAVRVTIPVTFTSDQAAPAGERVRLLAPPRDEGPPPEGVVDVSQAAEKPTLLDRQELARLLREHYPPLLRDAGITGNAVVRFIVDEQGTPRDVRALSATHEAFGEAAVAVMGQARFKPAKNDGKPVAVRITLPVSFALPKVGEAPSAAGTDVEVIREALRRHHPQLLAGGSAPGTVWFVVNARGEVVSTGVEPGAPGADPSALLQSRLRQTVLRDLDPSRVDSVELLKGAQVPAPVIWVRLKDA
jgi:TonB family protein